MITELNHCLNEVLKANAEARVTIAAELSAKYRKKVQYNLEATKGIIPSDASQT